MKTVISGPSETTCIAMNETDYDIDRNDVICFQIFGGRAITQTGMGKHIERFQRTYKFGAILGGSEEIMADLGIRQSMRSFPSNARL